MVTVGVGIKVTKGIKLILGASHSTLIVGIGVLVGVGRTGMEILGIVGKLQGQANASFGVITKLVTKNPKIIIFFILMYYNPNSDNNQKCPTD